MEFPDVVKPKPTTSVTRKLRWTTTQAQILEPIMVSQWADVESPVQGLSIYDLLSRQDFLRDCVHTPKSSRHNVQPLSASHAQTYSIDILS